MTDAFWLLALIVGLLLLPIFLVMVIAVGFRITVLYTVIAERLMSWIAGEHR